MILKLDYLEALLFYARFFHLKEAKMMDHHRRYLQRRSTNHMQQTPTSLSCPRDSITDFLRDHQSLLRRLRSLMEALCPHSPSQAHWYTGWGGLRMQHSWIGNTFLSSRAS
jgi:hypothetical protein